VLGFLLFASAAQAGDADMKFPSLTVDGQTYSNVVVFSKKKPWRSTNPQVTQTPRQPGLLRGLDSFGLHLFYFLGLGCLNLR